MNKTYKSISIGMLSLMLINPISIYAKTKTETIYATLNYKGEVEKTTINTKLSEIEKGNIIDYTNLEKIKNINGKEKFERDGKKLTWKSTGKDIYYQGVLNDSLPITVQAKYYLNGKEMQPNKIKGKKGNIKIEINLMNNDYNLESSAYVPFVVNATMILDNNKNQNINITNGKTISTGTKTVLTSISAPGLYESIKIDELSSLNKIEISYDTTDFEINDIYFITTPKLLSTIDIENINKLESTTNSIYELQDGMNKLDDGAKKLLEGSNKITAESEKLAGSLEVLSMGQNTLNDNIQGITSKVNDATTTLLTLNEILTNIYQNNFNITEEDFNKLPEEIKATIISIIEVYKQDEELMQKIEMLNNSLETIYNLYELGKNNEEALVNVLKEKGLDDKTIELLINVKRLYESKYEENKELIMKLKSNLDNLIIGEQGVLNTISSYLTIVQEKSNELSNGSSTLAEGLTKAYEGSVRLTNALSSLSTSTSDMSNGITKINQEGINKLTNVSNELGEYSSKARTLINLSNNYKGFSSDDADETIFIYKISMK